MSPPARGALRWVRWARLAYGGALAVNPGPPLRAIGAREDRAARGFTRVLGGRYLVEGLLLQRPWRLLAAIDALHAASMLAYLRAGGRHRRVAAASATLSLGFAAVTAACGDDPVGGA